jgi:energy-coupling factor transporter ATP-binding protein EcfA2
MTLPRVFVSYNHQDEEEKNKLLSHLGAIEQTGRFDVWSDDRIGAGDDWKAEIVQAMAGASIAVLLITADFLNSKFILGTEVPAVLQRLERGGLRVFPVIAKACPWRKVDWLARMNVRPKNGRPVWGDGGSHVDEDLAVIAEEIADAVAGPFQATLSTIEGQSGQKHPNRPGSDSGRYREEWLESWDLRPDPFSRLDGGTDPHLSGYFYWKPVLADLLGNVPRFQTLLLFGVTGSGKSSLRNAVAQTCRRERVLPVVYHDLGALVDPTKSISVEDHVTQLLEAAIAALTEEVEGDSIEPPKRIQSNKVLRNCLWQYVTRYERGADRKEFWRDLLRPDKGTAGRLPPADYRALVGSFSRYASRLFGYKGTYFLVDPDEDFSPDDDVARQVLRVLLSKRRLLELSRDGVAFKFFLDLGFLDLVPQIPWIAQEQDKLVYQPLEWTNDELKAVLRERLWRCSTKRSPHVSLGELCELNDLDDIVIGLSHGRPRELTSICNRLFDIHCKSPTGAQIAQITESEVDEMRAQLSRRRPESKLTRLIVQGESSLVEFKSTMRFNLYTKQVDRKLEKEIATTLSGFMNAEGGTLIIGVGDNGVAVGLADDFSTLAKKDEDGFQRALTDIVASYLDLACRQHVSGVSFPEYDGKRICLIQVEKSQKPVFLRDQNRHEFNVRVANSTRGLDPKETLEWVKDHFEEY